MKQVFILALFVLIGACSPSEQAEAPQDSERARLDAIADGVTIIRDKWGIPHIYGKTDADAVFGMIYAQAEDDFNRIELNFINAMGRLAEAEGEGELYRDLRMKLFIDPEDIKAQYAASPDWLKALMDAWADGLNYYLMTHPEVTPKVIQTFEPWMALTFSEGSIGGDIERVNLRQLENFYGDGPERAALPPAGLPPEPQGSNGFAIAPSNSASGNALLLINPHTSFYFRAEVHMVSEEGLNAYGAVTWGQFFIYQGFNENAGWMHTSSGADAIDEYLETVFERGGKYYYRYGDEEREVIEKEITLPYKTEQGMAEKTITAYYTHHGPIIRGVDGKWVSVKLMNNPVDALMQSYGRTKTKNYAEFKEVMELHTNSSNNTVFADREGNIAYFHGNFIPRRDTRFDWSRPVDGSDPATEWQGLHSVDETVGVVNPDTGWLQNTNNWPYSVIGEGSPKQEDFPPYMATFPENYRGINAIRVLKDKKDFTLNSLRDAAYDSYLAAFDDLLPPLFTAFDAADGETKTILKPAIDRLKAWDRRFAYDSGETSLAIYWGRDLMAKSRAVAREKRKSVYRAMIEDMDGGEKLSSLKAAIAKLIADFGAWDVAWGDINRFQRLTGDIVQPFDDDEPSFPVAFASARWGSLAAYGQRTFNGTKKNYGTRGNSFVAVVEFGDTLKAKAVTAGGQSGDVNSPHFDDQAELYAKGEFRDVYFYKDDIRAHSEREYKPGQ